MAVPGLFCSIRSQNAHVPNSYLAARCPYRSAYSRKRYTCRSAAENGRVWFFKVFLSHVSLCSEGTFYSTANFIGYCNYLRCLCHFDAEGYEKTDCLLQCKSYGFCDAWSFHLKPEWYRRWNPPNDKSWYYNRRPFSLHRDAL